MTAEEDQSIVESLQNNIQRIHDMLFSSVLNFPERELVVGLKRKRRHAQLVFTIFERNQSKRVIMHRHFSESMKLNTTLPAGDYLFDQVNRQWLDENWVIRDEPVLEIIDVFVLCVKHANELALQKLDRIQRLIYEKENSQGE